MRRDGIESNRVCSKVLMFALILMLLLSFAGCSAKVEADISSYETETIEVRGLEASPITVTPKELAKLDCKKETVSESSGQKTVTVKAIGPTLETLAESRGKRTEDFQKVIVTAADGYVRIFERFKNTMHK